ncbi:hypothetical protein [Flavobacterium faecale]|uniref:hypothetical protein n=1 Tax=Flavobacterium faecale TaxID=1355330 RepID=UPI003AAD72F9
MQLAEKDRNMVFLSPSVVRYLLGLGKHAIVKDKEIETIKEWLNIGDTATKFQLCNSKLDKK